MKNAIVVLLLIISSNVLSVDIPLSITSNGVSRNFILHAPGSQVSANLPVVFVLHGDGGSGSTIKGYSGFDAVSDASNFIAIYPSALNSLGQGIWNKPINADLNDGPNDVLFISDMIDYLCETYAINLNKVYATGHSGGAFMAYHLAMALPNKIAAIAPVAGSMYGDNSYMTAYLQGSSFVDIPIYHVHGDADPIVSYPDPNHQPTPWSEYPLSTFSFATCGSNTYLPVNVTDIATNVKKILFCANSANSKEISLIRIVGGGHGWPNVAGYNVQQGIWDFFNQYQLSQVNICTSDSTPESLLSVNGKFLMDNCGDTVILKGLNHGNIYDVTDFGAGEIEQINQTGANAVRLVVSQTYCTFPPPNFGCVPVPTTATQVAQMLEACAENKLIPIVELHDFTGSANPAADLIQAANWWIQPSIKNVLLEHQNYLIINIANEPSQSNYPPSAAEQTTYLNANINAIQMLRDAGFTCPIMIDGMHWGKDHTFFVNHGASLMAADPMHNLLYSVHAYWPSGGVGIQFTDAQIINNMNVLATVNAPIVLGEIAHDEVQQNSLIFPINYELLMDLCAEHDFGYLIWWWGRIEPGSTSDLYITTNGLAANLTSHGNVMINTHPNSIANTATKPYKLIHGDCASLSVQHLTIPEFIISPNPSNGFVTITTDASRIDHVELVGMNGKRVRTERIWSENLTIDLEDLVNGIYLVYAFDINGKMVEARKLVLAR